MNINPKNSDKLFFLALRIKIIDIKNNEKTSQDMFFGISDKNAVCLSIEITWGQTTL